MLSPRWGDTLLRNEENGLPRQYAYWLAMTVVFDTFRSKMSANPNEKYVIAKPEGLWQSVTPASEGCSAAKSRRIPLHR